MPELQIISDLHLESPLGYDLFEIPVNAPYLALLGDIGWVKNEGLFTFLEAQLQAFKVVFFILGNHEPFHSDWATARDKMYEFSLLIGQKAQDNPNPSLGEFVFLDQTRYDIDSPSSSSPKVTILGCTLYSKVLQSQKDKVSFGLNDFYYIKNWTVGQHTAAHESDLAWLNSQVSQIAKSDPQRKIVILTHHSPTMDKRAIDIVYENSPISSGFVTDLSGEECWKNPQVCFWAFGHTHYNCDFREEATGKRIVTNQRKYYFSEAKGFNPAKVVGV